MAAGVTFNATALNSSSKRSRKLVSPAKVIAADAGLSTPAKQAERITLALSGPAGFASRVVDRVEAAGRSAERYGA